MKRQLMVYALTVSMLIATWQAWVVTAESSLRSLSSLRESPQINAPEKAPIIAATKAGSRIVAVGDYGIAILSDDGRLFRQARMMPTRVMLTSVFFLDAKRGWAAGHDGTVVVTTDAGETWQLLREEPGKERALLSIWFENAQHGFAVGQFGLVIETYDGGMNWSERKLVDADDQAEKHLLQIFSGDNGLVLIAAESGSIFRSEDNGHHWESVQIDNKGSFWTGMALKDGTLLIAGMRGHIYRSDNNGTIWNEVSSGTQQSLTGVVQRSDGSIRLIGMSGVVLTSKDGGKSFENTVRPDRVNLTSIVTDAGIDTLFSLTGILSGK